MRRRMYAPAPAAPGWTPSGVKDRSPEGLSRDGKDAERLTEQDAKRLTERSS